MNWPDSWDAAARRAAEEFRERVARYRPFVFWCQGCGKQLATDERRWCPLGMVCSECVEGLADAPADWWIPF